MQSIQFLNVTPDELQKKITEDVINHLNKFLENFKPKQANDYLTRKEVAKLFDVDLSTLHNWNKSGKLKPLALGNRIYYLRSDIEQSLTPLNSQYHG